MQLHQTFHPRSYALPISERAAWLHRKAVIIDPCVQYLVSHTERSARAGLAAVGLTIPMEE